VSQSSLEPSTSNTGVKSITTTPAHSVAILETVSFTLLHNMFTLLTNKGHNTNKTAAEINFHLTKSRKEKGFVNCAIFKTVLPYVTAWFTTAAVRVLLSWY
jgi:hypothetical protein